MGATVRVSWGWIAIAILVIGCGDASLALAQAAQGPAGAAAAAKASERRVLPVDDPVADPKAMVTIGNARFTVLTPQLIRMEWSADGKFEDHASFVFINRKLPVPKFEVGTEAEGSARFRTIKTDSMTLTYDPAGDGHFTPEDLSIDFDLDGKPVVWHPGDPDSENLQGTTRTLDTARGSKTEEPIGPGLVSRAGWVLVDDSTRPLFDSADFRFLEWRKERVAVGDGAAGG